MKAVTAVAEILKREGTTFLIGYPVNPIIEAAAQADIRTIIVRQERTGLHMADAVSRITSGLYDFIVVTKLLNFHLFDYFLFGYLFVDLIRRQREF
jgi:glyoxylate carboligase